MASESISLITGYPDNHCLVTRYPNNRYETRLTQPKRAAQPSNEIQSTKYYVRIYQRIMQNKPNVRKSQMNVNSLITMNYENKRDWTLGQNKPNSNPIRQACVVCLGVAGLIKPNFRKAQMNVNLTLTKDYRKKDDFSVRINKPNSNPISSKAKMSANAFSQKDYENKTAFRLQKTNPKQSQFPKGQNELKIACRKIRPHPCRLSHIFGLQFGLIVAKYSKICDHRFVSDNKAVQRAEQYLSFTIDVVK